MTVGKIVQLTNKPNSMDAPSVRVEHVVSNRLPSGKYLRDLVREYAEHEFKNAGTDASLQIIQASETLAYNLIIWLKGKGY